MLAPSAHAKREVSLGGRTYGASTETGRLAPLEVARAHARRGRVTLAMPRASAALVTIG
jgi:hypothetical protein